MKKILFCLLLFITLHLNAENQWLKSLKSTVDNHPWLSAMMIGSPVVGYCLWKKSFHVTEKFENYSTKTIIDQPHSRSSKEFVMYGKTTIDGQRHFTSSTPKASFFVASSVCWISALLSFVKFAWHFKHGT